MQIMVGAFLQIRNRGLHKQNSAGYLGGSITIPSVVALWEITQRGLFTAFWDILTLCIRIVEFCFMYYSGFLLYYSIHNTSVLFALFYINLLLKLVIVRL